MPVSRDQKRYDDDHDRRDERAYEHAVRERAHKIFTRDGSKQDPRECAALLLTRDRLGAGTHCSIKKHDEQQDRHEVSSHRPREKLASRHALVRRDVVSYDAVRAARVLKVEPVCKISPVAFEIVIGKVIAQPHVVERVGPVVGQDLCIAAAFKRVIEVLGEPYRDAGGMLMHEVAHFHEVVSCVPLLVEDEIVFARDNLPVLAEGVRSVDHYHDVR